MNSFPACLMILKCAICLGCAKVYGEVLVSCASTILACVFNELVLGVCYDPMMWVHIFWTQTQYCARAIRPGYEELLHPENWLML